MSGSESKINKSIHTLIKELGICVIGGTIIQTCGDKIAQIRSEKTKHLPIKLFKRNRNPYYFTGIVTGYFMSTVIQYYK